MSNNRRIEFWDIYNNDRKKTGKVYQRDKEKLIDGEYHVVVTAIILNLKNEILISKRSKTKKFPLMWECNGGSIIAGETSLQGILREIKEELGIEFKPKEAMFLKTIKNQEAHDFKDIWVFKKDINLDQINHNDGEVSESKFVSISEYMNMYNDSKIAPNSDFNEEDYIDAINLEKASAYEFIDKTVRIEISKTKPQKVNKLQNIYPINCGYVPDVLDGDGKKIECYIVGIDKQINEFTGKCIAVLHKFDNTEDKLIVAPNDQNYSDNQIRDILKFQEKNYLNEIIR